MEYEGGQPNPDNVVVIQNTKTLAHYHHWFYNCYGSVVLAAKYYCRHLYLDTL